MRILGISFGRLGIETTETVMRTKLIRHESVWTRAQTSDRYRDRERGRDWRRKRIDRIESPFVNYVQVKNKINPKTEQVNGGTNKTHTHSHSHSLGACIFYQNQAEKECKQLDYYVSFNSVDSGGKIRAFPKSSTSSSSMLFLCSRRWISRSTPFHDDRFAREERVSERKRGGYWERCTIAHIADSFLHNLCCIRMIICIFCRFYDTFNLISCFFILSRVLGTHA